MIGAVMQHIIDVSIKMFITPNLLFIPNFSRRDNFHLNALSPATLQEGDTVTSAKIQKMMLPTKVICIF